LIFELIEGGRVMRMIMQSQTLKFYKWMMPFQCEKLRMEWISENLKVWEK
jgi:hypothetical protein